jgi:hypothetical protein
MKIIHTIRQSIILFFRIKQGNKAKKSATIEDDDLETEDCCDENERVASGSIFGLLSTPINFQVSTIQKIRLSQFQNYASSSLNCQKTLIFTLNGKS